MLSWLVALLGVIRLLAVIRPSQAESALCAYGLQLAWLCVEVPIGSPLGSPLGSRLGSSLDDTLARSLTQACCGVFTPRGALRCAAAPAAFYAIGMTAMFL